MYCRCDFGRSVYSTAKLRLCRAPQTRCTTQGASWAYSPRPAPVADRRSTAGSATAISAASARSSSPAARAARTDSGSDSGDLVPQDRHDPAADRHASPSSARPRSPASTSPSKTSTTPKPASRSTSTQKDSGDTTTDIATQSATSLLADGVSRHHRCRIVGRLEDVHRPGHAGRRRPDLARQHLARLHDYEDDGYYLRTAPSDVLQGRILGNKIIEATARPTSRSST